MESTALIGLLPYSYPFLFVDDLDQMSEKGISGSYTFPESSFFYQGHFRDNPITPGVILTECMAQIGVVCLGIYLLKLEEEDRDDEEINLKDLKIAMSNIDVDFFLPVSPGEKVKVISEKEYFRFNKLKCKVQMRNIAGKLVCKGDISGMILKNE